ncbi:MAG: hypothetical protein Q8S84_08620 [bacterium]|nr:hypothetical protein [bacterium]
MSLFIFLYKYFKGLKPFVEMYLPLPPCGVYPKSTSFGAPPLKGAENFLPFPREVLVTL